MSDERLLLKSYLKTLKLPTVRAEYEAVARRCNQADASYEEYLEQLVELEVQHRLAQSIERRLKQAGLFFWPRAVIGIERHLFAF